DLWSLGVVLYEMGTGIRPFRGDNVASVLHAILHDAPTRVSALRGEPPGSVDSIIARLLAKDPDHRYPSTEQLIADLARSTSATAERLADAEEHGQVSVDVTRTTDRPRRRWSRHLWWYTAATVAAATLVATSRGPLTRSERGRNAPPITMPDMLPDTAASAARLHALDLYNRGLTPILFRSDSGRRAARDLVRQATVADSTFAPAHAALAILSLAPGAHSRASLDEAERSARTAVRLDSSLARAWAALGRVMMLRYRFAEAETHLRHAVELDPKTDLREFLIWLYVFMDRPGDALREAEEFLRQNPTEPGAIAEVARGYLVNGRCDEALAQLDRLAQMQPPPARVGHISAQCHAKRKEWPQAITAMRRVAEGNEPALAYLGFMLARAGQRDSARAINTMLLARHARGEAAAWGPAVVYAGLGDVDRAFEWISRAHDDGSLRPEIMEPLFEELRADARFDRLRRKLGLATR
ncbi:MAG TPA: tetratricopeptide repeat protein, partial [Gemmatimonadaceae bacterium]|nr:tetratricopeptide repeat protein [Gemmatimonadaceae bacterium]